MFVLILVFLQTGKGQFQENQRINSLTIQTTTDTFATQNHLFAAAFTSTAVSQMQSALNTRIMSGESSLILEMPGLTDLTGTNQLSLQIGTVDGLPVLDAGNPSTYSGASDLDWWYTPNANELDANDLPSDQIPASISGSVLNGGPAYMLLPPDVLLGTGGPLMMSNARFTANVGSSSKPLESVNGFPPGHLPSEDIDTTQMSFASMSGGKLKGNISAASLANIPLPATLQGNNTDQNFGPSNSILDLIITGAKGYLGLPLVIPTQPDESDPNAPLAGAGPPYKFAVNGSKVVTAAFDKDNTSVDLQTAMNSAAYSAYFTFTTDRVIVPITKTLSLGITSSWNLVSVPLGVKNLAAHVLFPTAISKAFAYNTTYLQVDTLKNGAGYWLKFPGAVDDSISGQPLRTDTIPVIAGWNLIGSISSRVAVASVQSIPPGMITSHFFGYLGQYAVADTIQPGKGYWVKVTGSGSLVLNAAGSSAELRPGVSGRIRIVPTTELPPPPPDELSTRPQLPKSFALEQNYPNPFNPITRIQYSLPQRTFVRLVISDVLGREITTLINEYEDAENKSVNFNASALPSGLYFFHIQAGEFSAVRKMVLLK
ncbi:MAG TPA: T9SS type A sorting domain-containing protein [Bacteroidota bacterium]|nr:T9SS type A sorting domain-containing protein [Bacteroidota bacterium]